MLMTPAENEPLNFIDEERLWRRLELAKAPGGELVLDVLAKARECVGLDLFEAAVLLQNADPDLDEAVFEAASQVKERIYGNRIVLFAPLYVTNECANSCAYCGFNAGNQDLARRTLTVEEIRQETRILEDMGHKRVLAVFGEHPAKGAGLVVKAMEAIYATRSGRSGEIRRVNVNCAPLSVEDFRRLKDADIGTYQCFQETYHRPTYERVHLGGRKKDFLWRLRALHRAQEAGIDDVAMGALFGLFDHRFEVLGLLAHAEQLEKDFGVGPHTISFPRLEPAQGSEMSFQPPFPVSDRDLKKIVAVLRLAVPYTGLILTTRESPETRRELLRVGVSQMSAGSRTYPGAYADESVNRPEIQQFCVSDERSLDEVIEDLAENFGYLPSFCTACYRLGRTGDHFMGLAKTAFIGNFCRPNALLTFQEYLEDYGSPTTRRAGALLLSDEMERTENDLKREELARRLLQIKAGERDLYY